MGIVPDDMIISPPSYSMVKYLGPATLALLRQNQGKHARDVQPDLRAQTREQVEQLVDVYQRHGVTVHRARPFTADEQAFLANLAPGGWPLYARDPLLVVGRNVIETSIMSPPRRKEIFGFREVLQARLADDPACRYVAMPQPPPVRITETMPEGPGPFLEGGDVFVLDKDVLVGNSGLASNHAGIEWLQRLLSPDSYRVHEVALTGAWLHLDCVLAVIRRGLVMVDTSALPDGLPAPIRDWEIVHATPEEAHALGCNTMCLRENVIVIGEEHERLINELGRRGVEIVPTRMDVAAQWGGGIRCLSHPLRREVA